MFSQWKAYLKRHYIAFNADFFTVHTVALLSITPKQGLNYFKKTTLVSLVEKHTLLLEDNVEFCALLLFTMIKNDIL